MNISEEKVNLYYVVNKVYICTSPIAYLRTQIEPLFTGFGCRNSDEHIPYSVTAFMWLVSEAAQKGYFYTGSYILTLDVRKMTAL